MQRPASRARARLTRSESRERIIGAATDLLRDQGYAGLNVGAIMAGAGIGRTIFYRHFEDLGDLLLQASREAIEALYDAELELEARRQSEPEAVVRSAIEPAVAVYHRHGPLLRALAEAAPGDPRIDEGQRTIRRRFDELVTRWLGTLPRHRDRKPAELEEIAHALNLLNTSYLLDAFGRAPRVEEAVAVRTLSEVWLAVARG
jgi:AcrR family transcriptional regulator